MQQRHIAGPAVSLTTLLHILEWTTAFSNVHYVRYCPLSRKLLAIAPVTRYMETGCATISLETEPPSRQQHMLARESCLNIPYLALFGYASIPLPRTFYHVYPNRTHRGALV